jgi:hypothetical protein
MNHGELNDSFTYIFQSAYMLLKRAFRLDQLLNPHPIADNPWLFTLGLAFFKSLILAPAVLLTRCEKDDFFPFTVWIVASMLISPNGSSYSLILFILPLLGLAWQPAFRPTLNTANSPQLNSTRPPTPPHHLPLFQPPFPILAALLLTAVCAIPVTRFGTLPLPAQFPRLYLILLFYFLLCRQRRNWNLALFSALTALFFALDIRGNLPKPDPSSYVLTKEAHLFIDDFTARNNRLIYSWRDDNGSHEQLTDYPVDLLSINSLELKDNQIFYKGKQITNSPDRKAKPTLINGEDIFYLSDKDRGFEFYTLRKITLCEITPAAPPPNAAAAPGASQ